jgi:FkbM family methyltransferase
MLSPQAVREISSIQDSTLRFREVLTYLEPGEVTIDCGANVGAVSKKLAARGCRVYAFEPDPIAAQVLRERFKESSNVVVREAAVGTSAGTAKLYYHRERHNVQTEMTLTQSSSLLADKKNVSTTDFIEVELVDLGDFIISLGRPVAVLKVDVEGAEGELLEMILARRLFERFAVAFFETHEDKVPSTRPIMERVRAELKRLEIGNIYLDWK